MKSLANFFPSKLVESKPKRKGSYNQSQAEESCRKINLISKFFMAAALIGFVNTASAGIQNFPIPAPGILSEISSGTPQLLASDESTATAIYKFYLKSKQSLELGIGPSEPVAASVEINTGRIIGMYSGSFDDYELRSGDFSIKNGLKLANVLFTNGVQHQSLTFHVDLCGKIHGISFGQINYGEATTYPANHPLVGKGAGAIPWTLRVDGKDLYLSYRHHPEFKPVKWSFEKTIQKVGFTGVPISGASQGGVVRVDFSGRETFFSLSPQESWFKDVNGVSHFGGPKVELFPLPNWEFTSEQNFCQASILK